MSDTILCPACNSEYTYENGNLIACSQCFNEWDPAEEAANNNDKIFDANGNKKFKNKFNEGIVRLTPTNSKTKYFAVIGKKLKVVRLSE